jgi:hypothetical protein
MINIGDTVQLIKDFRGVQNQSVGVVLRKEGIYCFTEFDRDGIKDFLAIKERYLTKEYEKKRIYGK